MLLLSHFYILSTACLFLVFSFVNCSAQKSASRPLYGTVTDLNIINSPNGVPLDFSYNETTYNNQQLISAPGCPKSVDGYPWIYSASSSQFAKSTIRCYLAGSQGPCPSGQVLFILSGSRWGVCGCECLLNSQGTWILPEEENSSSRSQSCYSGRVQQIFDRWDKTVCYNVNEQGPCANGLVVAAATTSFSKNWTSKTGFLVACLPPCGEDNWTDQSLHGNCTAVSPPAFGGAATALSRNICPDDEKFSKLLQKCVKRQAAKSLVVG